MYKTMTLLSMTIMLLFTGAVSADTLDGRWSVEKANQWYDSQPWLVGANFVPSTAINQLEMWQPETFDPDTIERELAWAEGIGMNTMRVYLHDLLWQQDKDAFLERVDFFLDICEKHHIKPMLILFDSVWNPRPKLGKQPGPKPHLHNSGWVQSPHIDILKDPKKVDALESYAKGVLQRFKDDTRILIWDLYNEPGNLNKEDGVDQAEKDKLSYYLLEKVFTWAREVNPTHPLTSGLWVGDFGGEKISALNKFMVENSDIITFHSYEKLEITKNRVDLLKPLGRPIICTEYMARTNNNTFADHLPYFKENNIGAINWGLVAGKTQTQYPWESWDKKLTAEPKIWFHEVFCKDGTPYDKAETDLIKKLSSEPKVIPVVKSAKSDKPVVKMLTTKGTIVLELYRDKAPITVENFLMYTKDGFYNGKIFHRVIPGFMIQGGGLTPEMVNKLPKGTIKNESSNKLRNKRGTIAMARKNPPDSASTQFFINHKDNASLDFDGPYKPGYAVFGKVIEGMDVVDAIASVQRKRSQFYDEELKRDLPCQDVPVEPIIIESVTVVNE